jgi:post-segregation antitoxin (ccd killing protein)
MGEETTQFASRFAVAVDLLGRLATDDGFAALRKKQGANLDASVTAAIEAIAAVHETGTEAVKRWAEERGEVLAQLARLRAAVQRGGVDAATRREARSLVELLGRGGTPHD